MSNHISPLRPAMTAIAAVIALSSTPLLAQTADGASAPAAPVVVAPPPPVETPEVAPAAAQTITPEIAVPAAPQPAMRTMSTPVVHMADTTSDMSAAPERAAPVKRVPAVSARASTPVSAAATPKKVPAEALPAAPPAPIAPSAAARPAPAVPAPVAKTATVQTMREQSVDEDVAPIVGAVGLGVLAIGGVAFAFRRRKRREDEDEFVLEPTPLEAATIVSAEPVPLAKVRKTRASTATLPNGFDISQFGRHTQAAYRGPTRDNPSHSLRRRLSRASFFDQRERETAEAAATVKTRAEPAPKAATARKTATAERDDRQVTVRMAPQRKRTKLGYAFQK